ncbi:MAG: tetratricopeptide repeat protein [Arcobacteraceae bacterium]
MKLFLLFVCMLTLSLARVNDTIEALPNILFTYDKLKKQQNVTTLQVDFNKGVALLEKKEYEKAIDIFKQTAQVLRVPSFLNIGIAYYKLNSFKNATIYLNQIYNVKELMFSDTYSFMSSAYYLYKITNEDHYLQDLINAAKNNPNLSDNEKRMLADTFIVLKEYKNALRILENVSKGVDFKKALLHLKLNDFKKSEAFLERAYKEALSEDQVDTILWFMIYRDLKSNSLTKLQEHLNILEERRLNFTVNQELPITIAFNETKYSSDEYLDFVTQYSLYRQIDMAFYFAPFVFSDNQEIIYDSSKGFIFNSKQNLQSLENMIKYNSEFINIIKEDPIVRVKKLKDLIKHKETKSYVYYNLALSLAQIHDFQNAHAYFLKAYKLNPGNKLYAAMTLVSAKRINKEVKDKNYIERNMSSEYGLYNYFGQTLYSLFINNKANVKQEAQGYKNTILYSFLELLEKLKKNEPILGNEELFAKYYKDPLVYLMNKAIKQPNENKFNYIARLQDTLPLQINNNFLEGSVIITEFYIDILKALALFDRANFNIDNYYSPSYIRTLAIKLIHDNNSNAAIGILEYLQNRYELKDKYTLYLMVAAYLQQKEYNEASLQISLIKALINDSGANFLNGVQLIQELKINSAKQFFSYPYYDTFIDFDLIGFDEFLESL